MSTETAATMPDYSHLIGKQVRIRMNDPAARMPGLLVSCEEIGPGVIFARIKRRYGGTVFAGGHFELEAAGRLAALGTGPDEVAALEAAPMTTEGSPCTTT